MRLRQILRGKLLRHVIRAALLLSLASVAVSISACAIVARNAQADFRPIHEPIAAEHSAFIAQTPKYQRPEDATYLSFPEWYLVFNPQEYAESLRHRPPSQFPYFKSTAQFWRGYAEVYGIARRHYRYNFGANLMVAVIGTSSTVEWSVKGGYENTVGRLSEWIGGGALTDEDTFAADVARDYGNFIPTRPWFEFPYGQKFVALWSATNFFGPHFVRKWERKFFLSFEYGAKWLYAAVIRAASHAVYGVADTEIYASAHHIPDAAFAIPGIKKVKSLGAGAWVVTLPHYQGFTDTVPALARLGVDFDEVAGNDEILLTLIAPAAWNYNLTDGRPLFAMDRLTDAAQKRVAVQVPIKSLGKILREIESGGLRLEHLFDY